MIKVAENVRTVLDEIAEICRQSGRAADAVRLMMVTKTKPADMIREALATGQQLIGENKVQEVLAKRDALADIAHEVHLIGHLQTNKVKDIVGAVHCIQSLDSIKLADKLQARLAFVDTTIDVLVQVNTSHEDSKFGVAPDQAMALIDDVIKRDRIRIKGLMTIGAHTDDEQEIRRCFRLLKSLQMQAQQKYGHLSDFYELSMGMSGDMRLAIEEGSTMVRVGSAIFGARGVL